MRPVAVFLAVPLLAGCGASRTVGIGVAAVGVFGVAATPIALATCSQQDKGGCKPPDIAFATGAGLAGLTLVGVGYVMASAKSDQPSEAKPDPHRPPPPPEAPHPEEDVRFEPEKEAPR